MILNCLFQHTIIFSQTAETPDIMTRAHVCQSFPIRCFFPSTWRGRKVLLNILPSTLKPTCEKSISHVERWNRKCAWTSLQPHFLLHLGCNIAVRSCLSTRPRVGQTAGDALPEEEEHLRCYMWKISSSAGNFWEGWMRAAGDAGCYEPPSLETQKQNAPHLPNSLEQQDKVLIYSCLWSKTIHCFHLFLPV